MLYYSELKEYGFSEIKKFIFQHFKYNITYEIVTSTSIYRFNIIKFDNVIIQDFTHSGFCFNYYDSNEIKRIMDIERKCIINCLKIAERRDKINIIKYNTKIDEKSKI